MLSPQGNDKSSWNGYAHPDLIVTQRMHLEKYLMAPQKSVQFISQKHHTVKTQRAGYKKTCIDPSSEKLNFCQICVSAMCWSHPASGASPPVIIMGLGYSFLASVLVTLVTLHLHTPVKHV